MSGITIFQRIFLNIAGWYLRNGKASNKLRDLIMWPVASRILGSTCPDVIVLKNGLKVKTDLGDILGRFVIFYGPYVDYFWEPQTVKLTEILIKDARHAIIAGSHIGYVALMARRAMVKAKSLLFAFEPVSYLYNISRENFILNDQIGAIHLHPKALSNTSGSVTISIDSLRSAIVAEKGGRKTEVVAAISVDEFIKQEYLDAIDFMLLDVEGHESAVFTGMKDLLDRKYPKDIIFEYSQKIKGQAGDGLDVYLDKLKKYQYNFYIIADDYVLRNVGREYKTVRLYALESGWGKFQNYSYVNILATKRDEKELEALNISIVK